MAAEAVVPARPLDAIRGMPIRESEELDPVVDDPQDRVHRTYVAGHRLRPQADLDRVESIAFNRTQFVDIRDLLFGQGTEHCAVS